MSIIQIEKIDNGYVVRDYSKFPFAKIFVKTKKDVIKLIDELL